MYISLKMARRYYRLRKRPRYSAASAARANGYRTFSGRRGLARPVPTIVRGPGMRAMKFLNTHFHGTSSGSTMWDTYRISAVNDITAWSTAAQRFGSAVCLNLVSRGNDIGERLGTRTYMRSLLLRGAVYYAPTCKISSPYDVPIPASPGVILPSGVGYQPLEVEDIDKEVTLLLVYFPRNDNANIALPSTFLDNPVNTKSFLGIDNATGARVLLRKKCRLSLMLDNELLNDGSGSYMTLASLGPRTRYDFTWKVNLGLSCQYKHPVGTVSFGSITHGALCFYAISNTSLGATQPYDKGSWFAPFVEMESQLCFTDV